MKKTNKFVLLAVFSILFISALSAPSFASAHIWGFDPSYTKYALTKNVTNLNNGSYQIDAEFVLCKRNLNTIFTRASKEGVAWCAGSPTKCCGGGYNETTGECNTLSVGIEHQVSCSIFGATEPFRNCMRAGMMYPQEAGNYTQYFQQSALTFVADHPTCAQYGSGNTGAWVSTKTFTTTSLDNYIVSAGAEYYNGDDDFATVPIAAVVRATPACTTHYTKKCEGSSVYWFNSCDQKEDLFQQCFSNQTCQNGQCSNVTCSTNSQCGTNGLIGSPFCQGNSVYKNYKTYTCNNPGTVNSYCSDSTAPQQQTVCNSNQTCQNGSCTNNQNDLTISCYATPNPVNSNQSTTFISNPSGGTGSYTYSWSGACSGSSQNCSNSFSGSGTQTATVSVTSGTQTNSANCSVNVNQTNTCTHNSYQRCIGSYLYWYDSCGNQESSQYCPNGCSNNSCQNNTCIQNSYQRCNGNYLYWYDSCGNQQGQSQYCPNGCTNNSCTYNPYGVCTYHAYKLCQGNDIYWYDSCGNNQGIFYSCTGGQTCQYGQCVSGYNPPVNNYVYHYRIGCYGNSLSWYDSVGSLSGIYRNCVDSNSCTLDSCSANKCSNVLKCDGSTCATSSADFNTYCAQTQNHCGNGTCEQSLGETTSTCQADCKTTPVVSGLSVAFFAKQNADSAQWQKSVQVGSNGKVYFMISAMNGSLTQIDNVTVSANIPQEITSLGNLKINDVAVSGDIVSGVNIGSLSPANAKSITFEGITQTISAEATQQATASSNVSGNTQSDVISIDFKQGQVAGAAVSAAESTTGFWAFVKRWYVWILAALVLIFLFIVVFKRLSSET